MEITQDIENKIRFLCASEPNREWSGPLFYEIEGSYEEKNLKIICKDLFLMDIGSGAHTEFVESPEIVTYMCEHPELENCFIGLIHSHNTMSTFFSGEDTNTLLQEGSARNHFVSLIVNNAGSYSAAITRRIQSNKEIKDCYKYNTFNNEPKEECRNYITSTEYIEYIPITITYANVPFKELNDRLKELKTSKQTTSKTKTPSLFGNDDFYDDYGWMPYNSKEPKSHFKDNYYYNYGKNKETKETKEVSTKPLIINKAHFEEDITPEVAKLLVAKLVKCNYLADKMDYTGLKTFVNLRMVEEMKKVFGDVPTYSYYIEGLVDYIFGNYEVSNYLTLSTLLLEELSSLPQNEYIKALTDAILGMQY